MNDKNEHVSVLALNPAVDISYIIPQLLEYQKVRAEQTLYHPGGNGINVARALKELEIPAHCCGIIAGESGDLLLKLLAGIPADRFVILLKHQPNIAPGERFDLQLSGHTHKGQIFPFGLLVRLTYPVVAGLHVLAGGARIYVSRGTGTWGPPIRILSPPEITLIELTRP